LFVGNARLDKTVINRPINRVQNAFTKISGKSITSDKSPFFSPESTGSLFSSELSPNLVSSKATSSFSSSVPASQQYTPPYQPSFPPKSSEEKELPFHFMHSPIFLYEPPYLNYIPFLKITENKALYLVLFGY
jgi:hypothetical protein